MLSSYWLDCGRFQTEYDELNQIHDFKWSAQEENAKYRYYRFYNDGDLPKGAKYARIDDVKRYLEMQVNIAVAKAYVRIHKDNVSSAAIKYFAKKRFLSFAAWSETN